MVRIVPPEPRSTLVEEGDGVRLTIPVRRNPGMLVFLPIWLAGWTVGGVMAAAQLLWGNLPDPVAPAFLTLWLILWAASEGFLIYVLCWNLAGREVVLVNAQDLITRREVFGMGRSQEFDRMQVRDLRCSPLAYNPYDFASGMAFWGMGGGLIGFDYGARTYRFGAGLDEAEAKMLVATLGERFPELCARADA
jgi:hypothetical protein